MSLKALRQAFMASRAACTIVRMSSRLLRHSCTCADTRPSSCLQCCVWFSARAAGVLDSALHTPKIKSGRKTGCEAHLLCRLALPSPDSESFLQVARKPRGKVAPALAHPPVICRVTVSLSVSYTLFLTLITSPNLPELCKCLRNEHICNQALPATAWVLLRCVHRWELCAGAPANHWRLPITTCAIT